MGEKVDGLMGIWEGDGQSNNQEWIVA